MSEKLTWKKVSRQTYTAPVGDGYYEIIEHRQANGAASSATPTPAVSVMPTCLMPGHTSKRSTKRNRLASRTGRDSHNQAGTSEARLPGVGKATDAGSDSQVPNSLRPDFNLDAANNNKNPGYRSGAGAAGVVTATKWTAVEGLACPF